MNHNKQQDELVRHYDSLIDENNDPVLDPVPLQAYMDKWDGERFIDLLGLSPDKSVLEMVSEQVGLPYASVEVAGGLPVLIFHQRLWSGRMCICKVFQMSA